MFSSLPLLVQIILIVAVVVGLLLIFRTIASSAVPQFSGKLTPNWTRDKVILHTFGRGPLTPSLSPFPLKLETFLRMAKIPYEMAPGRTMSSKGKTPWMEYNGKAVADSQFCIEHLNKERNIDLNSHLNLQERAIARAFQKMIEENFYWCLVVFRWVYTPVDDLMKLFSGKIPKLALRFMLRPKVQKMAHAAGMGRHEHHEVEAIYRADLTALSNFIGDKKFLFGDRACETDCAIFGMLAQLVWHMPGSIHAKTINREELRNLREYCARMREAFWPDWDDCTLEGNKKRKIQ